MHQDVTTLTRRLLAAGQPAARIAFMLTIAAATLVAGGSVQADTASWASSDLDAWVYNFGSGARSLMPTFSGGIGFDENNHFEPKTVSDVARLGMTLVALNTGVMIGDLPPTPRHIKVNSVTVTIEMDQHDDENPVRYSTAQATHEGILQELVAGQISSARPMELYGVGFRAGYTGFGFGAMNDAQPPLLEENTPNRPGSGYITYPVAVSTTHCCGFDDVSNSLTGGYSATASGNTTSSFNPDPFAIGTAAGLNEGDVIPNGTTFSFALDLSSNAMRQYVQRSFFTGGLGFMLSSWHFTGELGAGGGYPDWFSKETSTPPTLTIDYEIVAPLDGDFDGDQDVDGADFLLWQCTLGTSVAPGLSADANGSGVIDGGDLAAWTANFGHTGAAAAGGSVPEPASAIAGRLACAALFSFNWRHSRRRKHVRRDHGREE
jgi:hypothetical protein